MYATQQRMTRRKYPTWGYINDSQIPMPDLQLTGRSLCRHTLHMGFMTGRWGYQQSSLRILTTAPIDILLEVFSHLHPLDLLHLARTTKSLRSILMSPSARSIWRVAFENVQGLPFCPPDMSEPQFASLAFDSYCHFCFTSPVNQVFWTCRIRCCSSCIPKQFVSQCFLEDFMSLQAEHLENDLYNHSYISTFPYIVYPKPRRNRPGRILYYLPIAQAYIRELASMKQAEIEPWRIQKKIEQIQRLTHAAQCESWSICWAYHPSPEYNMIIIICLLLILIYLWRDTLW